MSMHSSRRESSNATSVAQTEKKQDAQQQPMRRKRYISIFVIVFMIMIIYFLGIEVALSFNYLSSFSTSTNSVRDILLNDDTNNTRNNSNETASSSSSSSSSTITTMSDNSNKDLLQRKDDNITKNKNDDKKIVPSSSYNIFGLRFVHIPKTGGSTIEELGEIRQQHWGYFDFCRGDLQKSSIACKKLWWIASKGGTNLSSVPLRCTGRCPPWHDPDLITDFYKYHHEKYSSSIVTFCSIRNPYDRILSSYKYNKGRDLGNKQCKDDKLNRWVSDLFHDLNTTKASSTTEASKKYSDCHFVPQSEYPCQHKLLFDNLAVEYNTLLETYYNNNSNTTISHAYNYYESLQMTHNTTRKRTSNSCQNLTYHSFDKNSQRFITMLYKKDFDLYNELLTQRNRSKIALYF